MASSNPRTRSQARMDEDTEDETDYTSANENLDETVRAPEENSGTLKGMSEAMVEIRLEQAKRDHEFSKREQEHRFEMAKREQRYQIEMAKRDQEHKEQMALMMEAITSLKKQESPQSGLRAKKVEMPKLGSF